MANIDTGRLLSGGLAAGLVINVVEVIANLFLLADSHEAAWDALGLDPVSGPVIGGFVALGFLLGMLVVWTYAAIRSRYGPGPSTAMRAGLAVWLAYYLLGGISSWLIGVVPNGLFMITLVYSLIMMLVAAHIGGMIYTEE